MLLGGLFFAAFGQGFSPELPFSKLTPGYQDKVKQELERAEVNAWEELFEMYDCKIGDGVSRKSIETEYRQCHDQDDSDIKQISETDFQAAYGAISKFYENLDSSPSNNLAAIVIEEIAALGPDQASSDAFEAIKDSYVRSIEGLANVTPSLPAKSQSQPTESTAEAIEEPGFIERYGLYLILLLSIIALAGIFFFFKNKGSRTPAPARRSGAHQAGSAQSEVLPMTQADPNPSEMSKLRKKISGLETRLKTSQEEIKRLQTENEGLRDKLRTYEEQEKLITSENAIADIGLVTHSAPIPKANHRYATYARSDGSFHNADITDDPASPHYFKLNLQNDTGTFTLTDDANIQLAAADSAGSVLLPVCEYENNPTEAKKGIRTEQPGQLTREGNRWQVSKKARIRFV